MKGRRQTKEKLNDHPLRKGVKRRHDNCHGLHPLRRRGFRAQNLIEFALIFPVLMLFIFGIVDFGRAFHVLIAISNAAREGARYGVGPGMDRSDPTLFITLDNEIQAAAVQEAGNSNLKLALADVVVSCPNTCIGEQNLRVVVSYTFTPIFDIFIPDSGITFVRDMEMMIP